jgi:CSLREA domain-containing protein
VRTDRIGEIHGRSLRAVVVAAIAAVVVALAVPIGTLATSTPGSAAGPWVASNVPNSGLNPPAATNGGSSISGISCPSETSCIAVGTYGSTFGVAGDSVDSLIETGTLVAGNWNWVAITAPSSGLIPPEVSVNIHFLSLDGVSCPSTTSCVAEGVYEDGASGEWGVIETGTLSGGTWSWVATTAPTGGLSPQAATVPVDELWGVSCGSAASCVLAGDYRDSSGDTDGLIETGTQVGGSWSWVESGVPTSGLSPALGAPPWMKLQGVSCVSANSCVAAGNYRYGTSGSHATNGVIDTGILSAGTWTWTPTTAPTTDLSPASSTTVNLNLSGVSCGSPTLCVATGSYSDSAGATDGLVETGSRSGSTWTWAAGTLPTTGLVPTSQASSFVTPVGVSCGSATSCVAVGTYRDSAAGVDGLIETGALSGSTWTWAAITAPVNGLTPTPSVPVNMFAMSCVSATTCVGAGGYRDTGGAVDGVIESGTLGPGSVTATLTPSAPNPVVGTQFSLDLHVTNTTADTQDLVLGTATANPSTGVTITPPVGPTAPLAGGQSADLTYTATIAQAGAELLATPLAATDESTSAVTNLAPTTTVTAAVPDLVVNSTADDPLPPDSATANVCDVDLTTPGNQCTLRAAIQLADLRSGAQAIVFDISGGGVPTIAPTSALPAATVPVTIYGTTQSGGWVQLSGTGAPTASGLSITGGSSTVRGLVVNGWATGISLTDGGGDLLAGNRIGTDTTGTSAVPNSIGISLHAPNSTIGATTASTPGVCSGDCNVISGNTVAGVSSGDVDLPLPARSQIVGNFVGTDFTGQAAIGNGIGIDLRALFSDQQAGLAPGDSILVGGPTAVPGTAPGNLVGGNGTAGIAAGGANSTSYTMAVEGNLVGATADGTSALGNPIGINDASPGDIIGGSAADDANIVVGSNQQGILSNGVVEGNRIGISLHGEVIKNVVGVSGQIGEAATLCGNTVSGNTTGLVGSLSLDSGNRIGTDPAGSQAVPNQIGIAPTFLTSGLDSRCADLGPDIVSGNTQAGVDDQTPEGSAFISVGRMYVGTNSTGTVAIPNGVGFALSGGTNNSEFVDIGAELPLNTNGTITSVQPCAYPCVLVSGNSGPGINFGATQGTDPPAFQMHGTGIGVTVSGTALQNNGDGLHSDVRLVVSGSGGGFPLGITNNIISNDRGFGINIAGAATGLGSVPFPILSNTISSNSRGGITVGSGDNIQIDGNTISSSPILVDYLGGVSPDLSGNALFNSTTGYVVGAVTGVASLDKAKPGDQATSVTATSANGTLTVSGTLSSESGAYTRIDVYGDTSCSATAVGRYPLAAIQLPHSIFRSTFSVPVNSVPSTIGGIAVTVTNMDGAIPGTKAVVGQTGGYSACVPVVASGPSTAQAESSYLAVAANGSTYSYSGGTGTSDDLQASDAHVLSDDEIGHLTLNEPIVGMASTPDGAGYWLVAADGGVFSYGDAAFYGSTGAVHLNEPIVGMAATPDGKGYWLVAADGGVFAFGDAGYFGSMGGKALNQSVVGIASSASGSGYLLAAADGGVFAFGDAAFRGSQGGTRLNRPVTGIASTPSGGYWLVASDGGVFSFDTPFLGSMGGISLNSPVVGVAATPDGGGYWLVGADGGIFNFGDAQFTGAPNTTPPGVPIVGITRTYG